MHIVGGIFVFVSLALSLYIKFVEKRSLPSWRTERLVWLVGTKKQLQKMSEKDFAKQMKEHAAKSEKPFEIDKKFIRFDIKEDYIDDLQFFSFGEEEKKAKKCILYLHGGAFVSQPLVPHFTVIQNIALKSQARVILPIYKKAPKHCFLDAILDLTKLYRRILSQNDPENIFFMGDSAGGGLALSFALYLRDLGLALPKKIIVFSPWLDIKCDNPDILKYEPLDPSLSAWGLNKIGAFWAKTKKNLRNPYVSPIFGQYCGMPPIFLFVGTHEIFYPDCLKFYHSLKRKNFPISLSIGKKMNHVYPLFPIPESRKVQEKCVKILKS